MLIAIHEQHISVRQSVVCMSVWLSCHWSLESVETMGTPTKKLYKIAPITRLSICINVSALNIPFILGTREKAN